MNHIAVESSMLASIAYDPSTESMEALFKREGLYLHRKVSLDLFERVLHPGPEHQHSVGKAYNALIRGRKDLPAEKLGKTITDTKLGESLDGVTPEAEAAPTPAPRIQEVLRASLDVAPAAEASLPPEVALVQSKSSSLAAQAAEIQVVDPDTQVLAADMLVTVAQMQTEIERTFEPMKQAAFRAHRVICDQETSLKGPLKAAEIVLKAQIANYVTEQNRLAREQDEANREAERERAEREAAAATVDQAIDQAIDLEARGDTRAAEAVLANPAPAPVRYQAPAPTQANVAATKGVSTRTSWNYRITDFNLIPREYLLVNESAIRNAGKNTQGRIRIAGVEFFEETVVATSRRG